jgi:hypothetical protein
MEPIDMSQKKADELFEKRSLQHGRDTLAAQQGDLRIEITKVAFDALSNAVRRRLMLMAPPSATRASWIDALTSVSAVASSASPEKGSKVFATTLEAILAEAAKITAPLDEIGRASLWEPMSLYVSQLRSEVANKIGPTVATGTGKEEVARAKEAATALSIFDTVV